MLLDAGVGMSLVLYFGVCVPAMHSVQKNSHRPPDERDRWLAYWVCFLFFVGPAMLLLPLWMPFRYEWMLLCISVLGYDFGLGAYNFLHGILLPRVRPYLLFLQQGRAMLVREVVNDLDRNDLVRNDLVRNDLLRNDLVRNDHTSPLRTRRDDDASSTSSTETVGGEVVD